MTSEYVGMCSCIGERRLAFVRVVCMNVEVIVRNVHELMQTCRAGATW